MSDKIYLVVGDNLPTITLTLDQDISGVTSAIALFRKRAQGSTPAGTSTSIPCTVNTLERKIIFEFPDGTLNMPGDFEAEIELDYSGKKMTLYKPLEFRVRQQFA